MAGHVSTVQFFSVHPRLWFCLLRSPDGASGSGPKWPARWQAPRNPGLTLPCHGRPGLRGAPSGYALRQFQIAGTRNGFNDVG